jgi:hypothetical protein
MHERTNRRTIMGQASPDIKQDPVSKITNTKDLEVPQVVEDLPSKCKALPILSSKHKNKSGHWWLIPVILATQEALIRGISV